MPFIAGNNGLQPGVVTVFIQRQPPSKSSEAEQQQLEQAWQGALKQGSTGTREIGGLTCFVPKPGWEWSFCSGKQTTSDSDVTSYRYRRYGATPFALLIADNESSRYGGIYVHWTVLTVDVSHALDIDRAVWNSLADWNLVTEPENKTEPR
jgi:hypothetical protein